MNSSSKYGLDLWRFILRKLNIKLINIKISIRILIIAKVIEEARQIVYCILPNYEVCTSAYAQKKLDKFFSKVLPLLLKR